MTAVALCPVCHHFPGNHGAKGCYVPGCEGCQETPESLAAKELVE